jgi:hypothetical protein
MHAIIVDCGMGLPLQAIIVGSQGLVTEMHFDETAVGSLLRLPEPLARRVLEELAAAATSGQLMAVGHGPV